jgi:hypothetical protein
MVIPPWLMLQWVAVKCGESNIWGVYIDSSNSIYVCKDPHTEFYTNHELGHHVWFDILTEEERKEYTELYEKAKKKGIRFFYREYSRTTVLEDFADNFALMVQEKSKPTLAPRINWIKKHFAKAE